MKQLLKTKSLRLGTIETKVQTAINASDEANLYLHGDIGDSWWGEGVTAIKVIQALDGIETDKVRVHINTYGGDVFEGIAIYNILKESDKNIVTYIDGIAASAGSLIALAGTKLVMPINSQLMIHNPWTYAAGNADDLDKVVSSLRATEQSIIATYMQKFIGNEDEIKELLSAEKFMTAEEAVAFGFADEIVENSIKDNQSASITEKLMSKYGKHYGAKVSETQPNLLKNFMNLFEGGTK
ncbi:head maturation protease, ClpP-related [Enterococcus faecalis]|uniref:head maturation protease, ClpP-related n=1 Tax=Enterococcus faecalis TaxID=1351 RepID=UPI00404128D2